MSRFARRLPAVAAAAVVITALLAACVPGGPPSLDQIADEFDETIEPTWTVEVPGIYGAPAIVGDLIAVYAQDDEDTMRLEVRDTSTGELVWEHVASPGGAWASPLFSETDSASRRYPIPAIQPFVVTRGEGDDAQPVVVFTERVLTDTNAFLNSDVLHVAELRTGEELTLSAPDFDDFETPYGEAELDDDGNVLVQEFSPYRLCGDEPTVCAEDANGGFYRIDVASLEVTNTEPEFDYESGYSRDFGAEFVQILPPDDDDGSFWIGRLVDGEEMWRIRESEVFPDGAYPADKRDFRMVGDLLLVQGYRAIGQNLDTDVFSYDFVASRSLAALDPDTGEVLWRADGVDSLCFAVDGWPLPATPEVIPVCHATAGSFEFDGVTQQMIDETQVEASVAGLDLSDGSLTWEVPHAGEQAILLHGRQVDAVFASGSAFAVVDTSAGDDSPEVGVLDLASGELEPAPEKARYLCEKERPGVQLKFQGSVFVSGSDPIALEYPAGWFQFACDQDAAAAKTWTKGAVRVGGLSAGDGRVVVVTEDGLAGFTL